MVEHYGLYCLKYNGKEAQTRKIALAHNQPKHTHTRTRSHEDVQLLEFGLNCCRAKKVSPEGFQPF
jgi:hypothetical protein